MKYFLKAVEEYVEKCSVTLKQIRKDIEPVIREIADSEEDYEYLMETVPRFYRDYYNADKEHLLMTNNSFEEWRNSGNGNSVAPNEEMVNNKDVLFSIHNHPNGYCFQSDGDWYVNAYGRTKYMLSVAKDGIMIVKDNDRNHIPNPNGVRSLALDWVNGVIDKNLSSERTKIAFDLMLGEISTEEANSQMTKVLDKYVGDNNLYGSLEHDFRESNKEYATNTEYTHDYRIDYVPITKSH